jgi:cell division protein FtsX
MRYTEKYARRKYWEDIRHDTFLTICVVFPIAILVFLVLALISAIG